MTETREEKRKRLAAESAAATAHIRKKRAVAREAAKQVDRRGQNAAEREARRRREAGLPLHGSEGKFEPTPVEIVSPYQTAEDALELQTEIVMRNKRRDILEQEHARGHIDDGQKANGDWFLGLCERAGIGGAKAIDYESPKVDSPGKADPLSTSVMAAHQELNRIKTKIGLDNFDLLFDTICGGRKISDIAADRYAPYLTNAAREKSEKFVGRTWRELLSRIRVVKGPKQADPSEVTGRTWKDRHTSLSAS